MVENALVKAVAGLVALNQDLRKSRDIAANAQRYRELKSDLDSLRSSWKRVASRARIARSLGATLPADYEAVRVELKDQIQNGFGEFERSYVSPEGVAAFKRIAPALLRRFQPLEDRLAQATEALKQAANQELDDVLSRTRIRTQCGLPADEAGVARLRDEIAKFFVNLGVLNAEARKLRWADLRRQLQELQQRHQLEGVQGLTPNTLTFLRRLMTDGKQGSLTLADLTPEIFTELRRFPALLGGVRLVRKGAS
ncbi:MAG TPA: hypothetical protein VD902_06675 [Symbiobacteriaceae bacterium]|nr:hypothetical protein [Symbiobacteriaceae bacterium]